jgi:hypothetical protein
VLLPLLFWACEGLEPDEPIEHQPIVGAHLSLECSSCHGDDLSQAPECTQCHEQDRLFVDHFAGQECGVCHQITSWSGL